MQASCWGAECMSMLLLLLASSCPSLQTGGLQAGAFFLSLLGVALPLLKVCMHTHEPSRDIIAIFYRCRHPSIPLYIRILTDLLFSSSATDDVRRSVGAMRRLLLHVH